MLLLLACAESPWTREAALTPLLARLDLDRSGRIDAMEWERVGYMSPAFGAVDTDGDGALSATELYRAVFLQDPLTFDGALERTPPDLSLGPGVSGELTAPQRLLWELFTCLREDAVAIRADVPVPDDAAILEAAKTGSLESLPSQEVLGGLAAAWGAVGLRFPALQQGNAGVE